MNFQSRVLKGLLQHRSLIVLPEYTIIDGVGIEQGEVKIFIRYAGDSPRLVWDFIAYRTGTSQVDLIDTEANGYRVGLIHRKIVEGRKIFHDHHEEPIIVDRMLMIYLRGKYPLDETRCKTWEDGEGDCLCDRCERVKLREELKLR